jgi:hypothetical protein
MSGVPTGRPGRIDQPTGVAPVGFEPRTRFPRDQGGSEHIAANRIELRRRWRSRPVGPGRIKAQSPQGRQRRLIRRTTQASSLKTLSTLGDIAIAGTATGIVSFEAVIPTWTYREAK